MSDSLRGEYTVVVPERPIRGRSVALIFERYTEAEQYRDLHNASEHADGPVLILTGYPGLGGLKAMLAGSDLRRE